MTNVRMIAFVALALIGLTSCAGLEDDNGNKAISAAVGHQTNIAPQDQQKSAPAIKPNSSCINGLQFNASFSHDRRFAYIAFSDSPVRNKLRSTNVASGFEYSNGKIVYREYKGKTTLTRVVDGHMRTSVCHQLPTAGNKTNHP